MNPKYASSDANMSAYDMITLNAPEGGFAAGENYYIAMRANNCPNGITAYIEYTDNVKARTSASEYRVSALSAPIPPHEIRWIVSDVSLW